MSVHQSRARPRPSSRRRLSLSLSRPLSRPSRVQHRGDAGDVPHAHARPALRRERVVGGALATLRPAARAEGRSIQK
eukprot:30747-Pelagococcus_subviridis.AAC.3